MAAQTYTGVDGKTYTEGGSAATPATNMSNQIGQYVTQNATSSGGHSYTESGYQEADGSLSGTPPSSQPGNTPSSAPITPTTTTPPVDTSQPNPTTVNATPYTSTSQPAVVSAAQAQANLASGGLSGDALAGAQKSLSAYEQGHAAANASGVPAPQDAGTGMSVATTTAGNASTGYTPPAPVLDAVSKATQQYTDDYAKYMSSESQGKTLVQQYQDISSQLGIPALNTELMNMKNVIDGTQDDIRNEVTKAGGFATDSQVLALSNARNKTMIQNYNNLLQTRSDAMTQLTTLSGLAAQDRQYASDQIDKQLNFDQQQITFATNAQTNAQNSIQKSIDNYGAASVYKQALATGDPTAVSRINSVMGEGFDLATAAETPTLGEQAQMAQIQASKASTASSYSNIAKNNADIAATQQATVQAVQQGATTADTVLGSVSKALGQVNSISSGFLGGSTSAIPGSPSKNLQSTIATIKSNLAFTELAKMRASSPTGGALGQISDKEEELLSSTVANLDVGQSPTQLRANLQQVQTHYVNYLQSLGYGYDATTGTIISP